MFRAVQAGVFAETALWSQIGFPRPLDGGRCPSVQPDAQSSIPLYPTLNMRSQNNDRFGVQQHLAQSARSSNGWVVSHPRFLALPHSVKLSAVEAALKFEPVFGVYDSEADGIKHGPRFPVNLDGTKSEFPFILSWFLDDWFKDDGSSSKSTNAGVSGHTADADEACATCHNSEDESMPDKYPDDDF